MKEAKKVCPELVLVHVETIGAAGRDSGAADAGPEPAGGGGGGAQDSRRLTQKACLERYRWDLASLMAEQAGIAGRKHAAATAGLTALQGLMHAACLPLSALCLRRLYCLGGSPAHHVPSKPKASWLSLPWRGRMPMWRCMCCCPPARLQAGLC